MKPQTQRRRSIKLGRTIYLLFSEVDGNTIFTQIENHDNCVYDFIEIRDGPAADSALLGKFCGYKMPADLKSTSNHLYVRFVSDASVQKAGFSASFMKEYDECSSLEGHGCEHECINTLGGYECQCQIGYELHSDEKRCESKCLILCYLYRQV